ncbi:hypothetical protein [Carboxylicivirga marina]|uniref:Uncharacterized protein n=1 Tax=Carboxylicivirga marina TaxID=2800988 RepID=A0ABS1HM14_9BACT|nr:hypothetical protein [Carboxylicivirga marina]MBK3518733.1 hypothetical protein [Carboxylicivirga marina]
MRERDFEITCTKNENGIHNDTIIKRWFASDWYYCPYCRVLFDENKNVVDIPSAPDEIIELVNRIDKQQPK